MDDLEPGQIITIAHGSVMPGSGPGNWDGGVAAIVFKTTEQAERALAILAMHALRPAAADEGAQ